MADPNNNDLTDRLELDPADGQPYIDELQDRLLELLSSAQTIEQVEERLRKLYPQSNLIDLAIKEAQKQRNDSHKSKHHSNSSSASFSDALHKIQSSVAKVSNLVRDGVVGNKAENELCDFVRRQKNNFLITRSDIRTAMHADKDLLDMFLSDDKSLLITENHPILARIGNGVGVGTTLSTSSNKLTITYKQKVRIMVDSENSFIRGLKLIIKVFKTQLEKLPHIKQEVQIMFCNIGELLELSTQLLTVFEDALESVGQEDEVPFVGSDILELAQAEEFDAYFNFAYKRLNRDHNGDILTWRKAYLSIVTNESTMTSIRTAGQSFDLAVKHLLPNYLLNTIIQFFEYFKNINDLYYLSKKNHYKDDERALEQTISILNKTKMSIESLLDSGMDQEAIEPLDPKQAESIRTILEKRLDIELQHERNLPLPFMPPPTLYRFSEPDSKDNIQFEDSQNRPINLSDRQQHSVRYEPDQIPVIRCATLTKLVERLTYHKYQPNIVDSFLTTYRSFISDPEELLDLLIERFKIPDPPVWVVYPNFSGSPDDLPECEQTAYRQYIKRFRQEYSKPVKMRVINVLKSWIKNHYYDFERHDTLLSKLNEFLDEVYNNDKVLKGLIVSIKKSIEQKKVSQHDEFEFMHSQEPPPILWWTAKSNEVDKFDILTLHPIEFARQLTLIEFDLFRAIRPSELINVRDLGLRSSKKEDKYESSPNLSRMTRHFTLLSYWIRKIIVEAEDFDKRSAIYNRAIEIMGVLRRPLNNFTGLLSIGSAIESAPIVRLIHTKRTTTSTTIRVIEDYRSLNDAHQKELQAQLKSCNPPCIPYLGSYQTKLIHAKEGNKTFIDEVDTSTISPTLSNDEFQSSFSNSPATPISPRTPLTLPRMSTTTPTSTTSPFGYNTMNNHHHHHHHLQHQQSPLSATSTLQNQFFGGTGSVQPPPKMINFKKQRIRADLVGEISRYQNQPYCLKVQAEIKQYIESIESEMINFGLALSRSRPSTSNKTTTTTTTTGGDDTRQSIEQNIPALTKCMDDYLFEQSERIEPKNCQKPTTRSKSKLPECWKSPGIKTH